jgi:hypothetical protein
MTYHAGMDNENTPCNGNQSMQRTVCGASYAGQPACQNNPETCAFHCGAKLRNSRHDNTYCPNKPVRGKKRCRMHGGKSPSGIGSATHRGKGYSSVLPPALRKRFLQALADPELLSLHSEAAMLQLRLHQLAEQLGGGDTTALWKEGHQRYAKLKEALSSGDPEKVAPALEAFEEVFRRGISAEEAWLQWADYVERKSKVAGREWKRLVDLNHVVTLEQALALAHNLGAIVKKHVADPSTLRAISYDLEELFNLPPRARRIEAQPPAAPPPDQLS